MTLLDYITPMAARRIYFLIYPGFELLDLSGPSSVFTAANGLAGEPLYEVKTLASQAGPVTSSAGISVLADSLRSARIDSTTTVFVVGAVAAPLTEASRDTKLNNWLKKNAPLAERFGSICSGTFLLHTAGLLSNKTVTTHWAGCEILQHQNQDLMVLEDALYHIDGKCWTSAGVTTGIDMALEMLKRDQGKSLMQSVAKYLVVYTQRPGKQSQFAQIQDMKPNEEDSFAELISWLKNNITRPVKINEMADYMCMSERSFQRKFTASFSVAPARFYERMRMEYARDFLLPKQSVEIAAHTLGYRSVAAFRTSFEKHFGLSPSTSQQIR
ncbi:MAG: DJ-1/PfpI family protein [Pseudomonadales bacterium]|nr:DJ-1/PfpI family protein [Pseudomonadales bacterium]